MFALLANPDSGSGEAGEVERLLRERGLPFSRFDLDRTKKPRVSWRFRYDNIRRQKPGQFDAGSGTTPTLMGKERVFGYWHSGDKGHPELEKLANEVKKNLTACGIKIKAEYNDGILALFIPRAERDKPRTIQIQ